MKKVAKKLKWFASGSGIALSGPYSSQAVAWKAMRLAPGVGGLFSQDTKVWPDDRTRAEIEKAIDDDRKARDLAKGRAMITGVLRKMMQ